MFKLHQHTILRQLLALIIGVMSGWIASLVGMPLPWMLGAMLGTTVLSMMRLPIDPPMAARPWVMPILGVMLGSSLTLEVLRSAVTWLPAIALMPVFIIVATLICMQLYQRLGGYSATSAFFAGVPGGINEMVMLAAAFGGDERRVALAHGLRVLMSIGLIGIVFGLFLQVTTTGSKTWTSFNALSVQDYLWLGGAAILGGWIATATRIPAGLIMLPMILSGILHVGELVVVAPPSVMVNMAQVVMGTAAGAKFSGLGLRDILPDIVLGAVSTVVMLLVALAFAFCASWVSNIDLSQTFLAFAPGGLSEMSLLALAMGQAVAFVSVLHIFRILLVLMAAPHFFRLIRRRETSR